MPATAETEHLRVAGAERERERTEAPELRTVWQRDLATAEIERRLGSRADLATAGLSSSAAPVPTLATEDRAAPPRGAGGNGSRFEVLIR